MGIQIVELFQTDNPTIRPTSCSNWQVCTSVFLLLKKQTSGTSLIPFMEESVQKHGVCTVKRHMNTRKQVTQVVEIETRSGSEFILPVDLRHLLCF